MSILVYTENWEGKFKKLSYELVSYATQLAEQMGTTATALSIGKVDEAELKELGKYGASKIITVQDERLDHLVNRAYVSVIAQAAEKEGCKIVVLANNFTGKALAPGVAVKMKAGVASAVTSLPVSLDPFTVHKGVFTGKAVANVVVNSENKVLTLFQNSVDIIEKDNSPSIEEFSPELSDDLFSTKVKDVTKVTDKILLTDAEIVVSGGRGMKSSDKWEGIEELASLLGAATACSRPVSDEGWRPHEEHVGQTGKIIAPNVYIALGISGAIQHLGGVSASKHIIAVNTDKDAPIFEAAEYGIVGDVHKVLPKLIEGVKAAK
jgi:electron transfer flavoprotein alpha subunit